MVAPSSGFCVPLGSGRVLRCRPGPPADGIAEADGAALQFVVGMSALVSDATPVARDISSFAS